MNCLPTDGSARAGTDSIEGCRGMAAGKTHCVIVFDRAIQYFGNRAHSLISRELDENIDTALTFVRF